MIGRFTLKKATQTLKASRPRIKGWPRKKTSGLKSFVLVRAATRRFLSATAAVILPTLFLPLTKLSISSPSLPFSPLSHFASLNQLSLPPQVFILFLSPPFSLFFSFSTLWLTWSFSGTETPTLSFTHTLILFLSLALSLSLSSDTYFLFYLTLILTHTHTIYITHPHTLSLTLPLPLSPSLFLSHPHSLRPCHFEPQ